MSSLCAEIGFGSINRHQEQLCGDHIEVVEGADESTIVVLADGLGSGVKASILSTLTATIISTMMSQGMSVEECVSTVAATLPVCSVRGLAYSTFTIVVLHDNKEAEVIQYDNPPVILLRDGVNLEIPFVETIMDGKKILRARFPVEKDDLLIAMSDGCVYAGLGKTLNFGWEREDIIALMETVYHVGYTAKTLNTILLNECYKLYQGEPGDDTSACTIRIRAREPMNLMFGPASHKEDDNKMMNLFFSKAGKRIICGGTTSLVAAKYLDKPCQVQLEFPDPDIPPIAKIEGVDLVTEGVVTINKVLSYAQDYLQDNKSYQELNSKRDGASMLARMLFEDATDINFFVGQAINPSHQNPDLPINFNIKMNLVKELSNCLTQMGKRIKINYF